MRDLPGRGKQVEVARRDGGFELEELVEILSLQGLRLLGRQHHREMHRRVGVVLLEVGDDRRLLLGKHHLREDLLVVLRPAADRQLGDHVGQIVHFGDASADQIALGTLVDVSGEATPPGMQFGRLFVYEIERREKGEYC